MEYWCNFHEIGFKDPKNIFCLNGLEIVLIIVKSIFIRLIVFYEFSLYVVMFDVNVYYILLLKAIIENDIITGTYWFKGTLMRIWKSP